MAFAWKTFFLDAGIPPSHADSYSIVFEDNRSVFVHDFPLALSFGCFFLCVTYDCSLNRGLCGHVVFWVLRFWPGRISQDMLEELNKEVLIDLGVTLVGHQIAIQRQAKVRLAQLSLR